MSNPVDTAKLGDAFIGENGVTWLLTDDRDEFVWVTSTWVDRQRWHAPEAARAANLIPLVPEGALPTPDASNPAHVRFAADVCEGTHQATTARALRNIANRLDTDAADRAVAEKIAQEVWEEGLTDIEITWPEISIQAALAGYRAGRDAAKAVQS